LKKDTLEYRVYQDELAKKAVKRNTLLVLPTGTGKTVIALLTILKWFDNNPDGRAFFLAPTRPLVHQHYKFFRSVLEGGVTIGVLTGEQRPERRRILWNQKIVFATPQILYNDLVRGTVSISNSDILIFDEAHRAVGNYAYVKIVTYLKLRSIKPRILAMTASPGDKAKTMEIINNLGLENLEIYTHDDPLIGQYFHGYSVKPVFIEMDPVLKHIINLVKTVIGRYVDRANLMLEPYELRIDKSRVSYSQIEEIRTMLNEKAVPFDTRDEKKIRMIRKILYEIILLDKLLTYLESYTYHIAHKYISELLGYSGRPKKGLTLKNEREIREAYYLLDSLIRNGKIHPKTQELINALTKEDFRRALVFTTLKENAYELSNIITSKLGIPSSVLVGRGNGKNKGMKQALQIKTLEDFSSGAIKVLVATNIGEEGLDISEVDLVIFYDNPVSVIRRIQRMGRTGRKQHGKVIFLILRGTRDEKKYYAGIHRYRRLVKELKELKRELEHRATSSTLDTFISEVKGKEEYAVIVDTREQGSIVNKLEAMRIPVRIESLEIGDYIIGRTVIERKTVKDFMRSLYEGRLFTQLKELSSLKEYDKVLLLEGDKKELLLSMGTNTAIGTILTVINDYKIPIYYSDNEEETANLLRVLYNRAVKNREKTERIRMDKKPKQLEEIQLYVLAGIPGIDNKIAKRLLERFGTLKAIANASPNDLMKIHGIGPELAMRIYRVFNHHYHERAP